MDKLLQQIQNTLNSAREGTVVDVAPLLSAADAITDGERLELAASAANPKNVAGYLRDVLRVIAEPPPQPAQLGSPQQ
jgi:hypothetical protein